MESLFKGIQTFLFDVLGLLLPGIIAVLLAGLPWMVPDHSTTVFQDFVHQWSTSTDKLVLLLLGCYLLGHVIKVWAKYGYRLGAIFFEKCLYQKLLVPLARWQRLTRLKHTDLAKVIKSFVRVVLVCQPPPFFPEMEELLRPVKEAWQERTGAAFPQRWHPFFKLAQATGADNRIPNEMHTYLAKYNFYRSMAFLFGLNFLYLAGIWWMLGQLSTRAFIAFSFTNFLFWFSFHVKYKRYWTLTGNEAIKVMYYFFFLKPRVHQPMHPEQS